MRPKTGPLDVDALFVVCGAGGFIGGHVVRDILERGARRIRAVDIKPLDDWWQRFEQAENVQLDLSDRQSCYSALDGGDIVYNLAADMGGMGFIESNKALCMLSVLINTHLLLAARDHGAHRFFYASSACVYNADKQRTCAGTPLHEEDAYPAQPEDGYGWEKLFSERMCRHFREDFGLETRIARYHNVYGPHGSWRDGREKAPAAICRKVARAAIDGSRSIEIWGNGEQARSFMHITDCVEGTQRLVLSDVTEPINIGSARSVTINELVTIVESIAGTTVTRSYNMAKPQGVNGRNSDNTRIRQLLGWEPSLELEAGLVPTYEWIEKEVRRVQNGPPESVILTAHESKGLSPTM